jgi:NAD(P)H-hydrate epimerase
MRTDPGGYPQRKISDVPFVSAQQVKEVQRAALEDYGCDILMITENGGRSTARLALAMVGGKGKGQRVVVLCGGGNKGATGLAAVRHLVNWGVHAIPVLGEMEAESSLGARRQIQILRQAGLVDAAGADQTEIAVEDELEQAELVIDALVGYGLQGPPVGAAAALTDLAVISGRPILAIDVPTGVNATTGEVSTPAIRAQTTLILDVPKRGLIEPAARNHVGELYLADIGIPRAVHARLGISISAVFNEGPIVRLRR